MVKFYWVIYMDKLIEYIKSNKNKVIAIDGPSGAGKSTIAHHLQEHFDCLVFHTDDYFLPTERKTDERLSEPGGNLDYERMENEIFKNLNQSKIPSHKFNCQTNQLEQRELFVRRPIIVIEGVYSLHPKFQKYYDLKVFVEIDRDQQLRRILHRSGEKMLQRFKSEWIPLEDKYFEDLNIKNCVNLFIKNSYVY